MTNRRSIESRIVRSGVIGMRAEPVVNAPKQPLRGGRSQKSSKYGNQATYVDGERFASKREAARYQELAALFRARMIADLRLHTRWPLEVRGQWIADYVDDFNYCPIADGVVRDRVVEDAKGVRTAVYKLKAKLMQACYGITIREV